MTIFYSYVKLPEGVVFDLTRSMFVGQICAFVLDGEKCLSHGHITVPAIPYH